MNKYFDVSRFWLFLKVELFKSRNGIAMTFVIVFGALFFLGFLLSIFLESPTHYDHSESYASTLILGGFIMSSLAFFDLGSALKRYRYLTLPVSAFERFVCMWLLTSVGWLILFTLSFTVYTWIANPVGQLLFPNVAFKSFDPVGSFALSTMRYYFVLQGIFLLGAVHFRGYVFPKTAVVLILFALVCVVILYFIMRGPFTEDHRCTSANECELVDAMAVHPIWLVTKWMFWWVLAPLSWVLTYLGLKDQEG